MRRARNLKPATIGPHHPEGTPIELHIRDRRFQKLRRNPLRLIDHPIHRDRDRGRADRQSRPIRRYPARTPGPVRIPLLVSAPFGRNAETIRDQLRNRGLQALSRRHRADAHHDNGVGARW